MRKAVVDKTHGFVKSVLSGDPSFDADTEQVVDINPTAMLPNTDLHTYEIVAGEFVAIGAQTTKFRHGAIFRFRDTEKCVIAQQRAALTLDSAEETIALSFLHSGNISERARFFVRFGLGVDGGGAFIPASALDVVIWGRSDHAPTTIINTHLHQVDQFNGGTPVRVFEAIAKIRVPARLFQYQLRIHYTGTGAPEVTDCVLGDAMLP